MSEILNIKEAGIWASQYLKKAVTSSNIAYLINYGRIAKQGTGKNIKILKEDLINYYKKSNTSQKELWQKRLGNNLNWALSFADCKETETTKHVHRLHPYKGKFIPQLVEYFLGPHTDTFKRERFFKKGDIILDPFCGSGTTLVQANELGIHGIGIEISSFNTLISNAKIEIYDLIDIKKHIQFINEKIKGFHKYNKNIFFETRLSEELKLFNHHFFPSPDYKRKVNLKQIDEKMYGQQKEKIFQTIYKNLIRKYDIKLLRENKSSFLDKWFLQTAREEMEVIFNEIKNIKNVKTKKLLSIILSRTIRSCRATTHSDLATLIEPVTAPYYCKKHGKICKPVLSIMGWWERYTKDTIQRIKTFDTLRTNTYQRCITADSRTVDITFQLDKCHLDFARLTKTKKINGIFSSPPYIGLIDYHEQHAYAYDLFGFERNDSLEIGPLYQGQSQEARKNYVEGIATVLINSKRFLKNNYNVFLVANDKYELYPHIAEKAKMQIFNQYKRPVLNRVEKDRGAYSETIFHLKDAL